MSDIVALQAALGIPQTGEWDHATLGAMQAYQQAGGGVYPMTPHGHPDAATLANLGYYAPGSLFPSRWTEYLSSGAEHPSTFTRDIATSLNQVPRWAWATVAVTFAVMGYFAYRGDKKRKARS